MAHDIAEILRSEIRAELAGFQEKAPEILARVTAGTATDYDLDTPVELPNGYVKTWRNLNDLELQQMRRALSF